MGHTGVTQNRKDTGQERMENVRAGFRRLVNRSGKDNEATNIS